VTAIDIGCGLLVLGGAHPDLERCRAELVSLLCVDDRVGLVLLEHPDLIDLTDVERVRSERMKLAGLTPREREVLGLLMDGAGTLQVSRRLGISAKTVKTHVQNILGKLDVRSRLEAVALATRNGPGFRALR
jgi:DNA-binding CsgD family transcriptional regulator